MAKKILSYLIFSLLFIHVLLAQNVGINTITPDASAALDITATDKGVLVPRLTTTQRTSITTPATGLLVYDTTLGQFYFYNGSAWTAIPLSINNSWTTSGTNQYNALTGNVGIGTTSPSQKLDVSGNINIPQGNSYYVGSNRVLYDNYQRNNVIIGTSSGKSISTASSNTVIGNSAMYTNIAGTNNVSLGDNTLYNTNSDGNTGIGSAALYTNAAGTNNTAVGYGADVSSSGLTNATAIGYNTKVGSSNSLILGNAANVGIGTSTPSVKLDIQSSTIATANIQSNGASAYVTTAAPSGYETGFSFKTYSSGSTLNRWLFGKTNTSESGSDVGSDFFINRYNDAGTYQSQPLRIKRSNGYVGIATTSPTSQLDINGTTTTTNLKMTSGAINGYVLQSDASGNSSWVSPTTLATPTYIRDADANTKIQTEETSNEDKIRFDLGGIEHWVMQGSRLESKNTGNSVFIGENAGMNDDLTDNRNIAIGYGAMDANTIGGANIAIGYDALGANVLGSLSVAIGRSALKNNTATSGFNTAVGVDVMSNSVSGYFNTALGYGALASGTTGNTNVAIGANALHDVTGNDNVALGTQAGYNATGSRNVFIGNEAGTSETGNDKLYIDNSSTTSPLVYGDFLSNYITINGSLGIGTSSITKGKVEINGTTTYPTNGTGYGYLNSSGNIGTATTSNIGYSLYASGRIAASEFNAFSDVRTKKILRQSNNIKDLATLMTIKITDYTLIDTIEKGNKVYKKVIAQEIAQVYPQAVSIMSDVIPDIYKMATIKDGFVALPNHNLKVGDKVKLIFGDNQNLYKVLKINENGFYTEGVLDGNVFVYGKEVNDFHTVDYEALSTLNISATQALVKRINNLEIQNAALKTKLDKVETDIKADIEILKAEVFKKAN